MSCEPIRGCGYRKVGGLYLVGDNMNLAGCDRLPLSLMPCPVCGEEQRFHRGISKFNALKLLGNHSDCQDKDVVCYPPTKAYFMWVGREEYTEETFLEESEKLGISKRIARIPANLELGVDWVFLAMQKVIGDSSAIFTAFRSTRVEKIITESQASEAYVSMLKESGITAVVVGDYDGDHMK